MNETREAFRHIRNGMLLVAFNFTILGFDILPNFVGWYLMFLAVSELAGEVQGIGRLRSFGIVLTADSIIEWIQMAYRDAVFHAPGEFSAVYGMLVMSIRIYFMYTLLTATADAAERDGRITQDTAKLCRGRNLFILAELCLHITGAVPVVAEGTLSMAAGAFLVALMILYVAGYSYCIYQLHVFVKQTDAQSAPEDEAEA